MTNIFQKTDYICVCTINELRIESRSPHPHYVEWKVGHQTGNTAKIFCNENGIFIIEKTFNIPCSINTTTKHKYISFIIKYDNLALKSKRLGSLDLNLYDYIGVPPNQSFTFPVISDAQYQPSIVLTISMIPKSVYKANSRSMGSQTIESLPLKRPSRHHASVPIPQKVPQGKLNSLLIENKKHHSRAHSKIIPPSRENIDNFLSRSIPINEQIHVPASVDLVQILFDEIQPLLNQTVINIDSREFDGIECIIYAGFLSINLFDRVTLTDEEFDSLIVKVKESLLGSPLLNIRQNDDKFFPLFGLLCLLKQNPKIDPDRAEQLFDLLTEQSAQFLSTIISKLLPNFTQIVDDTLADPSQTPLKFQALIQASVEGPIKYQPIIQKALIEALDSLLFERFMKSKPSFMSSAPFNTFCTIMRNDYQICLNKFTDGVAAMQMCQAIAYDPSISNDICPNISPSAILQLIRDRTLDDVYPEPGDIEKIVKYFVLPSDLDWLPNPVDYQQIIKDGLGAIKMNDWNRISIPDDFLQRFRFIARFFQ